uniref:NADH dehydrogenase subunit 5 n=1 Tax=Pissodes yunnanensis TaxID=1723750 RepID=UPI00207ABDB8|nr:NADH dehydrogenase subunit 5 [Pissodes yunnanensis]URP30503.1 NADH dehydrogenase subunit 5 [Pissodes yunnanensis]
MILVDIYFSIFLFLAILLFLISLMFLDKALDIHIELDLLSLNSSTMSFIMFFDWISLVFMSFVFFIASMIIKYSYEYMHSEKNLKRFLSLMILFVSSMMFVILSPNLISILLGWDGLGLVSYALVIYYQNISSFNAGMLTALSNRVGDAALLMSIALMMNFGSWNFMYYIEKFHYNKIMTGISLFIILASLTKSAQIPFSSWLPAAMAAPTPVSSLVHSSTLVTAGVYLLFRFYSGISEVMFLILLFISMFTMFMAGVGANFEFDLKKIIALSTLSQLGMMIMIMSLGSKDLAFFHLLIHALFKALLFMCAGAMIHNLNNCQDIRCMGGVLYFMPVTCVCMFISNLALCGLPFLSGFYSKDLIAEVLSMKLLSILVYLVFFVSVGLTVSYTIRVSYYMFLSDFHYYSLNFLNDKNNKIMLKGMVGLVFLVIIQGSVLMWLLFPSPYFIFLPFLMKIITLLMILLGVVLGYELMYENYNYFSKSLKLKFLVLFFSGMWNMPILTTMSFSAKFLQLGSVCLKSLDFGWFEYYGSKNLFLSMKNVFIYLQKISLNHMKFFLLILLVFYLFILL